VDLDNLTYPDGYSKPSAPQIDVFKTWIWWNNEICNNCFTKIRSIGEEIKINGLIHTHYINSYYERTENGIQAHTAFELASNRYGQTFCKECGSDTKSLGYDKSLQTLVQDAKNVIRYINHPKNDVPYHVSGSTMATVLKDLKAVSDNQGYDTEILAVATIEAMHESD